MFRKFDFRSYPSRFHRDEYSVETSTSLGSSAEWTTTDFIQGSELGTSKKIEYTPAEGDTARFFQIITITFRT